MEITNIVAVLFIYLLLLDSSRSSNKIAASQQNELGHQEPLNSHTLSRAKRQIGYYGYGAPYYGWYRRPYPIPVPIIIGGGFGVGRGFGGQGFGGRGFGGRGFGGRGVGGRGIGGRGGVGGGRGGRG